jgi:nitroimidazol reductase NimA-like FMN-containing flavoprotein (pyridoxamine 5'-phosphate oxidase superfamily)
VRATSWFSACLRLLATATLGRVGVSSGALPSVLPVNFRFDGRQILIRTGTGTKLDAALDNAVVAFEVDEIDPVAHASWSVMVTGIARELTATDELRRRRHPRLPGGHPGTTTGSSPSRRSWCRAGASSRDWRRRHRRSKSLADRGVPRQFDRRGRRASLRSSFAHRTALARAAQVAH